MQQQELPIIETRIGEFWTAKQRDGHSLHEISYRACYKPQLPAYFIEKYCRPGDRVYDPFMGRGTTLLEAKLRGCHAIGNDINPLSRILTEPRLVRREFDEIRARIDRIQLPEAEIENEDLLVFFERETLKELHAWRAYFRSRKAEGRFDLIDGWIQMVACNRLTGHSNGFFSVYTLPPNQATSLKAQIKINEKRKQVPEYRDTKALILKKTKSLLRHEFPERYDSTHYELFCESADATPAIPDASIDLVVTSPPFLDVVDYIGDNWLRNWFCEVRPDEGKLWQLRKIDDWMHRMTASLRELKRVLAPGGRIAFEVGEVNKGSVKLEEQVVDAGAAAGLTPEYILINTQHFTKTANCWGVDNNAKGTNSNRIVLFRK
ncbi:MAG: DNA methyltransferase [Opitutales bacterium]